MNTQLSQVMELRSRWRDKQGHHVVKVNEPIRHLPARYRAHPWTHDTWGFHHNETSAREWVALGQRVVRFMDATGLRVSAATWPYLAGYQAGCPPWVDHTRFWIDSNRRYLVTTEPYLERLDDENYQEMAAWCREWRWSIYPARPGCGIWNPPNCTLIVMSPPRRGGDARMAVAQAVTALESNQIAPETTNTLPI